MKQIIINLVIALYLIVFSTAGSLPKKGQELARFYDSLDVEHHWLAKKKVNWRTGETLNKKGSTHCSAFVAAAAEKLGVYILRPPEHDEKDLANAQWQWLATEGSSKGWKEISNPYDAQRLANDGKLVIAVINEKPKKSGHIVLVRPSEKSKELIRIEGPDIVQVGNENKSTTSLKNGFSYHDGAWTSAENNKIKFYFNEVAIIPTKK